MGRARKIAAGFVIAAFVAVLAVVALMRLNPGLPYAHLFARGDIDGIELPDGFDIDVFAEDVPGARSLAIGPEGTVFVGSRQPGAVYALPDEDADGRADEVLVVAQGLDSPNGVALHRGDLYVAEISRILRFPDIESNLRSPPEYDVVYDAYPTESRHGWKFIAFGPDDRLYVPVGVPCNICDLDDPFGTITRMNPDGTGYEIFAEGVRNTVGFDFHPQTGDLWFTDNGHDWAGDDRPPDELNHAPEAGMHFGFPYCWGQNRPTEDFGSDADCSEFTPPVQDLGPHVAALGMRFYTGDMFPDEYENQIFIAEHGSWNRVDPIGYRVTLVRLDNGAAISYEPFAEGWLQGRTAWGRPVDVEIASDGSLLISDDRAGSVYRITFEG